MEKIVIIVNINAVEFILVPACSVVFVAIFDHEGAGFSSSESELVPESLETIQSVLR